jgi:hypothetical protein
VTRNGSRIPKRRGSFSSRGESRGDSRSESRSSREVRGEATGCARPLRESRFAAVRVHSATLFGYRTET